MPRIFRWAAAALIVVYFVVSPGIIRKGLSRDLYRDWLTPQKPVWQGRIELWHIADFKVYQGSVTRHLEERAIAYGKAHRGVHIEVIGMTPAQYESRIARGAVPDAYSFPSGLVYAEQLRGMDGETPAFPGALTPAEAEGEILALPWLMSGYFLVVNTQLMVKHRMELPENADAAFLQKALELDADAPQLYMPPVLAARAGLTGSFAETGAFEKGRVMLAVLDARALGALQRDGGVQVAVLPYGPYTDQVQYLGAARAADDARAGIVADFAAFLLTCPEQERLSVLGALPVIAGASPVYAQPEPAALHEALQDAAVPDPFSLERHRAALIAEAEQAVTGDAHAKMSFLERMAVVESGEL